MKKRRTWVWLWLAALLVVPVTAAAAIPGPHRAICPQCFGLTKISDDIWTDAPRSQHAQLFELVSNSRRPVEDWLGPQIGTPRIILCTLGGGPCDALFGPTPVRGLAWGAYLVRLNPQGINPTIVTHELFHIELHARMGQWGMWTNSIPRWFNEGMAVHVSRDARFTTEYSDEDEEWARSIVSLHDWKREVNADTWPRAYGASAQIIMKLEKRIGADGLKAIIRDVTENNLSFEKALEAQRQEN
ncbi:MAG: hypothetical protein AAGG69_12865 [Pseudomonadota bacterium]